MTPPDRSLTRGSLLARNVMLSLGGSALPALAAVVAVPVLLRGLGDVRFSILMLAWTTLGYFSLVDLGIGRAVTHGIADRIGSAREEEIGPVIWTSLALLAPVGLAGSIILYLLAPWLAVILRVPAPMLTEATLAFRILAVAVPFAGIAGALRGAMEARQLFGIVNALRVPHGLITFAGPLLALPFSRSLIPAVTILTAGRIILCVAHYILAARAIPAIGATATRWSAPLARSLVTFGGWLQLSYIVSPLMATLDRFVVGAVLGVGMVTYYAAPNELVTKLWLFNFAVLPVFFSALATTATRDPERTTALFDRLLRLTLAVIFLPAFVLVVLAPDVLRVWLGGNFASQSTVVMQVLTIAVLLNCVGQGAYTLIQGLGRPDLTGKYHLAELPFYALLLWWLLPRYGILGAAIAWSVRTIGDTALLMATCPRLLQPTRVVVARMGVWLAVTGGVLGAGMVVSATPARMVVAILMAPAWLWIVWHWLLTPEERRMRFRTISGALRPEQA